MDNKDISVKEERRSKGIRRSAIRRLRIPMLSMLAVVMGAFIVIPLAFDVLNIQPQVVEVAGVFANVPTPSPSPIPAQRSGISAVAVNTPQPEEPLSNKKLLKPGDNDAAVIDIQERLVELKYIDGDEPSEFYGAPIEAAVKRFQRVHHMKETGEADELTQDILFSDGAAEYRLEPGDKGEDVESLQERLLELGYEVEKTNGYFGVATEKALRSFQKKNKIDESGILDSETSDILYSNHARPKVDPTPSPTPKPKKTPKPEKANTPSGIGSTKTAKPDSGSSSGGNNTYGGGTVAAATGDVHGVINTALAQQGKPYVLGDEGPNSFDCSGLVHYALKQNGVKVGRMSAKSFAVIDNWPTVSFGELQPGDLLFFHSDGGSSITHTGIWLGGSRYVHASASRGQVVVSSWSDWAQRNFSHGKRVFY